MSRKILFGLFLILISVFFVNRSFSQAPTISSFSPSSGPVGTLVTITGTNLNNPTSLTIGGVSAIIVSNTGTQLVGMVMPGAATGNISMVNPSGSISSINNYTLNPIQPPFAQQGNKLVGTGIPGAIQQGYSVSLSADGNTAIIGAPMDGIYQIGAAVIFTRNGDTWSQQGDRLTVSDNVGFAHFGNSVALSADGNTAIIGGSDDDNGVGASWIFKRTNNTWAQEGNKLVGTGSVSSQNNVGAKQGTSVSISADGNTAVVGGPNDNNNLGAIWVFIRNGSTWAQQGNKLFGTGATDPTSVAIGTSVSISADGNTIVVGGPQDREVSQFGFAIGASWIFSRENGNWSQQGNKLIGTGYTNPQTPGGSFSVKQGTSVAINANGTTVIVGAPYDELNNGSFWVFTKSGNSWTQQGNKLTAVGTSNWPYFGGALSLSCDGNTAVVGAKGDNLSVGAALIFKRVGNLWSQQGNKLVGTGYQMSASQGTSVAISSDATTVLVGGPIDYTTIGATWVFKSTVPLNAISSNSNLSNLTLSAGTLSSLINPAQGFTSSDQSYTSIVSNTTNSITITPTAADANATIGIRYTGPLGAFIPVTSGSASAAIPLNVGNIGIEIKVTAQDASTKTYLVVVTRQAANVAINSFSPSSGPVGTLVTITGSNLNNPNSITIGGVPALVISNNGTQLVAMVMPGAVSGNVVINTVSGNATGPGTFTVKNTAYPSLQQGDKLSELNNTYLEQGRAVAISADGNTVIVGTPSMNEGGANIYIRNGVVWEKQGPHLFVPNGQLLGWAVAISADGNTVVMANISLDSKKIGAFIFVRNSGVWSQQGNKIEVDGIARFAGVPLAISGDGNTIIFAYSANASFTSVEWAVYKRNNNSWSQESIIPINNLSGSGYYWNVALSSEGNTALIGHPGEGVWFFQRNGNTWSNQDGMIKPIGTANFGTNLSISADGNIALVSDFSCYNGPNNSMGAAFVFNRNAGHWTQKTKLYVEQEVSLFGVYISLSADGKTAIIQGNNVINNPVPNGGNWIFTNRNDTWQCEGMKFTTKNIYSNPRSSLAISSDGNTAIVGVPEEDGGGAYIYVADPLVDAGNVSGGNSGGLESKSLGNAVVKRVYAKAQNNLNGPDDYNKMQKVISRSVNLQTMGIGSISELKLSNMMPDISSRGLVAYNSTPTDITNITNAKEVLSTDFTSNQQCKAVAFATKTQGELYDHTKPICDRLKGASLENVETIKIAGFDFIKYTMHNDKGQLEYATSFSIGTKTGRPDFTVQSTWLLKDYVNEENMYNFQLWAATPELVTAMVTDVLNKLQNVGPVKTISNSLTPNTYILSGKREATNLNMVVANTGISTSGYFLVEDKSNEDATSITSRKVPFTISANGKSSVSIPMNDNYESTITMYINNSIKDVVYMSDGSWYADYNKATTSVSSFNVTNDSKRIFTTDEYPIFRNVELKAVSKDYVSIVKLMKGGGMEADVSAYKGLKITASGGHSLHIVLVKNSIVNWKDQYYADIQLEQDQKDYFISLDKFISDGSQTKLKATDISAIVFSVQTSNTSNTVINTSLSNISFTKEDLNYLTSLDLKEIQLYPNPVTGNRFSCNFVNSKSTTLTLSITDANGRLIQSQQVNASKGNNSIPVNISMNNPGIYIVSLEGMNEKYQSKKLVVAKY